MIARIAALDLICPQFAAVTAWILRAATLAIASGQPLRLDPCVLLGAPGVGKSFYAHRLAQAFGVATLTIPMNTVTDRGTWFSGLAPVWRASAPGKIAQLLLDCSCASPVIFIDELEKSSPINPSETPVNVLHSLLEKENAARFTDEFLEVPIRADHIIWIATANDLAPLPASIVDRLIAFEIALKPGQMLAIQRSLFDEANDATGGLFATPTDALLEQLMAQTPRAMSRLWPIAFGFACVDGRRHVTRTDLAQAEDILRLGREAKGQIGFLSGIVPPAPPPAGAEPRKTRSRD
ncbi:AAA family ATPase [Bosea sp. BH3]|uniref:AAA family ATPase n=1 Tax=Bosea sp. BH3 TaxID=2871701 RepID=UPI0021CAEB55|nr:AAA family ATPase [Bosea sp. BH3]MCU4178627.1 AAA family ATPase [Bosea sp. BH3]